MVASKEYILSKLTIGLLNLHTNYDWFSQATVQCSGLEEANKILSWSLPTLALLGGKLSICWYFSVITSSPIEKSRAIFLT